MSDIRVTKTTCVWCGLETMDEAKGYYIGPCRLAHDSQGARVRFAGGMRKDRYFIHEECFALVFDNPLVLRSEREDLVTAKKVTADVWAEITKRVFDDRPGGG